jgi:hypothetical protein
VGVSGHEIVVSADQHFAYIPIYSDAVLGDPGTDGRTIDVVDLRSWKVVSSIDLGRPLRPHSAVFAADGLLYVTAELANAIEIVDTAKSAVVGQISTGKPQSHMLGAEEVTRPPMSETTHLKATELQVACYVWLSGRVSGTRIA